MLNDAFGGEDVVEVARGVVLLRSGVVGNPISVDDKLNGENWQSACDRGEEGFGREQRAKRECQGECECGKERGVLGRYGAG